MGSGAIAGVAVTGEVALADCRCAPNPPYERTNVRTSNSGVLERTRRCRVGHPDEPPLAGVLRGISARVGQIQVPVHEHIPFRLREMIDGPRPWCLPVPGF